VASAQAAGSSTKRWPSPRTPLHLALLFGLPPTTASKYTLIAFDLLAGQLAETAGKQHRLPVVSGQEHLSQPGSIGSACNAGLSRDRNKTWIPRHASARYLTWRTRRCAAMPGIAA